MLIRNSICLNFEQLGKIICMFFTLKKFRCILCKLIFFFNNRLSVLQKEYALQREYQKRNLCIYFYISRKWMNTCNLFGNNYSI